MSRWLSTILVDFRSYSIIFKLGIGLENSNWSLKTKHEQAKFAKLEVSSSILNIRYYNFSFFFKWREGMLCIYDIYVEKIILPLWFYECI